MGSKAGSHGSGQSWAPPPLCGGLSGTQGLVSSPGREGWLPGSLGSRTGLPQHPGPLPRPRASSGRAGHCRAGRAGGPCGSQIWKAGSRVGSAPVRSSPRPQATSLSRCHPGGGLRTSPWPVGGGHTWGTRASRQLGRGSWRSSRMGAVGPAGPQCARLVSLCLRACGQGCSRALLQAAGGGEGGIVPATHGEQALLNSSWGLSGGGGSEGREGCVRLQAAVDAGWEPSRTGSS